MTQDLIKSVKATMEAAGLTQAAVAKEAGVSAATLNQWLNGKYEGDNAQVAEKLEMWLNVRQRQQEAVAKTQAAPAWVDTATAGKVISLLQFAQIYGEISVVYGSPGLGKTFSLRRYAETSPNVWIATMSPDTSSVAVALEEIAAALGIKHGVGGGAAKLRREIVRRVRDTNGLIIVDEAQHLSPPALESIRAIYDATGIGLALVGNESVYARLTGGTRAATFAQMFSRIGKRLHLVRPVASDVEALAAAYGITGKSELTELKQMAAKPGALRGLVKALRLASIFAAGEAVTLDHIRAAWLDLGGDA